MKKYKNLFRAVSVSLFLLTSAIVGPVAINEYASADRASCEASGGSWVTESEVVGGVVTEGSFCSCPQGSSSIDGSCTNSSSGPNNNSFQDPPITTDCTEENLDSSNCGIIRLLVASINVLSGLAGIAIIASIVFAGYQYMTAQDNSGRIQQARQRIIWALTALFLLIFMYAFLNWLVPGGVL